MRRPTIWASPRPDKHLDLDDAFLAVTAVLITFGMVVNIIESICGYNLPFVIALELCTGNADWRMDGGGLTTSTFHSVCDLVSNKTEFSTYCKS